MTTTQVPTTGLDERVSAILPVLEEHAALGETERRLPDASVSALREAGLFKSMVPKRFGGDEVPLPEMMRAIERISVVDPSAGWIVANNVAGNSQLAFLPEDAVRELVANGANTPGAGSVIPRGRAVPVPGGFKVTGRWPLASGAHHAEWLAGGSLIFDGEVPRMGPGGAPDLKIMFFRASEATLIDTWHSLGLRGTGSIDMEVKDVFVPDTLQFSVFTDPPVTDGPLYRAGVAPLFAALLASVGLGIARCAIDAFVELAGGKTPTLSQTSLGSRPTVHAEVARAEATLQSARSYIFEVMGEFMESLEAGQGIPDPLEARRRLSHVHLATSVVRAVDSLAAIAGSSTIYSGQRMERCVRDAHTYSQHLLVSPVWWEKTGQYYFGMGLGMP